ncbi:MAG: hypothetical protein M1827_004222 [Pycnora praestabilis]|nr:MAG: hypothetical protein M1827_004222 [Pycnora praestabilis]
MTAKSVKRSSFNYTTITGFFLQDEPTTAPDSFDYTTVNFGLMNRPYDTDDEYDPKHEKTQWQRFEQQLSHYNIQSGQNERYILLYLGRHGQGVHNVAEDFYGTHDWNCYWSKKDGNETDTWADAHLTPLGEQQARIANKFWATEIVEQKIPVPERYYTSPLDRCLVTANITFSGLDLPSQQSFIPTVKELLRETIGIHTCDRRSNKTYIHDQFPDYPVEAGFTEEDELWSPDWRESDSATEVRLKKLLDDVVAHDDSTYISLTAHSGAIAAILRAVGHQRFSLRTGAVMPVLIKAETVPGNLPSKSTAPPKGASTCKTNPTPSS